MEQGSKASLKAFRHTQGQLCRGSILVSGEMGVEVMAVGPGRLESLSQVHIVSSPGHHLLWKPVSSKRCMHVRGKVAAKSRTFSLQATRFHQGLVLLCLPSSCLASAWTDDYLSFALPPMNWSKTHGTGWAPDSQVHSPTFNFI